MDIHISPEKIKLLDPKDLKPNPKNRNKHSDEQIERLIKLIEHHGFRQPIIVSNRSGLVVAGHGRLEASKRMGLSQVPVAYQDFDSDDAEYSFGISDNAIGAWAELDLSAINVDLPDFGPDMNLDMLGIKNFVLDPAEHYQNSVPLPDKNHLDNFKNEPLDHECPQCGFKWTD